MSDPTVEEKLYRVLLIGKPNVGKSLLFNQLTGKDFAIVNSKRGVTRDSLNAVIKYREDVMLLSDLAGLDELFFAKKFDHGKAAEQSLEKEINRKITDALDHCDLLVVVVDIKDITTEDYRMFDFVKARKVPTVLCANKLDRHEDDKYLGEAFELFKQDVIGVSAKNKVNLGKLKEKIFSIKNDLVKKKVAPKNQENQIKEFDFTLSVVGKPNAGKSSLLNALLQKNRAIVSEIQGTTRDIVQDFYQLGNKTIKILDTAGLRKKGKVSKGLESYANQKTIHAVNQSDLTILVVDASLGITEQDKKIISFSFRKRKSLVVVLNKWDLVRDTELINYYKDLFNHEPMLERFPVIKISCTTRKNFSQVTQKINQLLNRQSVEMTTSDLNKKIQQAFNRKSPPAVGGKSLKVYYAVQSLTSPPRISLYVNSSKCINKSYHTYLQKYLEKAYQLEGVPLNLQYIDKTDSN